MKPLRRLGVLGGMGPLATADFLRKLVESTPAECDQDHVPTITYSVPQVPDRVEPILTGSGPSPLPAMIEGLRTLESTGVEAIAVPCITAHFWFPELSRAASVPVFHIADATLISLEHQGLKGGQAVALLGTAATLQAGFFQARLQERGLRVQIPSESQMVSHVLAAIAAVKRGARKTAFECASHVVERMLEGGAERVVLACTELPLAMETAGPELLGRCVDPLRALAVACVDWAGVRATDPPTPPGRPPRGARAVDRGTAP